MTATAMPLVATSVSGSAEGGVLMSLTAVASDETGTAESGPTMQPTRVIYYAMPAASDGETAATEDAPAPRLLNVGRTGGSTGIVYTMAAGSSGSGAVAMASSSGQMSVTTVSLTGAVTVTAGAPGGSSTLSPVAGVLSLLGTLQPPAAPVGGFGVSAPTSLPGPALAAMNTLWTSGNAQLLNAPGAALGMASTLQGILPQGNVAPAPGPVIGAAPGLPAGIMAGSTLAALGAAQALPVAATRP